MIKIKLCTDKFFGQSDKIQEGSCDGIALNLGELNSLAVLCYRIRVTCTLTSVANDGLMTYLAQIQYTKGIHGCIAQSNVDQHLTDILINN